MIARFLIACAALTAAAPVAAQTTVTTGADVSVGDYGSSRDTTILTAPLTIRQRSGPVEIAVTVPYMRIETPGVVFSGIDGTPVVMSPDLGGPRRVHEGIGDRTASLSYTQRLPSDFFLRATGRVKVPVGGARAVSTGKVDWSVSGEVSRSFKGITPFASLTYRHFGDVPAWNIRDGFAASVGASANVLGGSFAASWDWAKSTSPFLPDVQEIVAVYDAPIASKVRLGAFATVGLTKGAADYGTGLRLTITP